MDFSRRSSGFTLIEMALIIILVGAIAGAVIPRIVASIPEDKAKESKEIVQNARDEVIGLALQHSEYRLVSQTNFTTSITSRTDTWGQPLRYIIANDVATGDALSNISPCKVDSTDLSVISPTGTRTDNIAYIVVSHGANTQDDTNIQTVGGVRELRHQAMGSASAGGREYDEIVDFVTLDYLKNIVNCDEYNPPNTNVDGNDDFDSFVPVGITSGIGAHTITESDGTKCFLLGFTDEEQNSNSSNVTSNYTYGCLWYGGNAGNCTAGDCNLTNGMRAYFSFTVKKPTAGGSLADGFTFGIISATTNRVGEGPCGGKGSAMGWASGDYTPADRGTTPFVDAPKIAVEFDSYPSGAYSDPGGNDHMAIVYWGQETAGNELDRGEDDNTHGRANTNTNGGHTNPYNGGPNGFLNFNTGNYWNEDATVTYHVRMDINRADGGGTTGNYTTNVWMTETLMPNNFDDVNADHDFTGTAGVNHVTDTVTMTGAYHSLMDKVIIGWTEGTGGARQQIKIKDFKAQFH